MSIEELDQIFQDIQRSSSESDFEKALGLAAQGVTAAIDMREKSRRNTFIHALYGLLMVIEKTEDDRNDTEIKTSCSFCGNLEDVEKLLVGAKGAICNKCCSIAHDFFNEQ